MNSRLVTCGLCLVLYSFIVDTVNGVHNEKLKPEINQDHDQSLPQHHHLHDKNHHKNQEKRHFFHTLEIHQRRHHKGLKTRQGNESSCTNICVDEQLAAVIKLLNGTREAQFLYSVIPSYYEYERNITNCTFPLPISPFFPIPIINASTPLPILNITLPPFGSNFTIPLPENNISIPIPINPVSSNLTTRYPIFFFLARLFGRFLSGAENIGNLLQRYPEFANIWGDVLSGLNSGGYNKTDVLVRNLRSLFACNGTFGENLFNFTNWQHILFPWNMSGILSTFENNFKNIASNLGK